jgi:hypothetical protein
MRKIVIFYEIDEMDETYYEYEEVGDEQFDEKRTMNL